MLQTLARGVRVILTLRRSDAPGVIEPKLDLAPRLLQSRKHLLAQLGLSQQELRVVEKDFGQIAASKIISGSGMTPDTARRFILLLDTFGLLEWVPRSTV
jgi:hypothetical protein